jgi:hypothetical protein
MALPEWMQGRDIAVARNNQKKLLSAPCGALSGCFSGADDEIRTRDPHLGKAMEPVRTIQVVGFVGFRAPLIRSSPQSFLQSEPSRIAR